MMRRIVFCLMVMAIVAGLAAPSFAAGDCGICGATTSDNHLTKTGSQLTRGVANVGGCWLEMANQPRKGLQGGGNLLVGVGKGIGHTCLRAVKGAAEIITAPMPKAKDGSQIATDCPLCMWSARGPVEGASGDRS